jgi:SAM-dependent methyltransferase
VRILDAGCGSSFLTFLLAWAYQTLWQHPVWLLGIDTNSKLIAKNRSNAEEMKLSELLAFAESPIAGFDWQAEVSKQSSRHPEQSEGSAFPHSPDASDLTSKASRPHAVVALHACDTATDDAIALAIKLKSDFIAMAPCCQAELARHWKDLGDKRIENPLRPAFLNPHLRREIAAHMTDLMRVLVLRGHGYEVTTTEFTMSHATPKNTLILAVRRGSYHLDSQRELAALVQSVGGSGISLIEKAPF